MWQVPFINFKINYTKNKNSFHKAFHRVLSNGEFILKKDVISFEKNLAKYLGVKNIISVNSGTDALLLILGLSGIKPGSEIITVANTYVATISAIKHIGAVPVFVDVREDFNIDPSQIEKKITKKTAAILPVHLNGRSCDMDEINKIAKKYKLLVIEDVAQSLGAKFKNKMAGTFGLAGAFSLHPLKSLSCAGDGGFIATNNENLAKKLYMIRNHGQKNRNVIKYYGFNSRLDNLQAALINIKFKNFNKDIYKRRLIANYYINNLKGIEVSCPFFNEDDNHFDTFNSFVIKTTKQKKLINYLTKHKIEVLVNWKKPIYRHKNLKLDQSKLENTEKYCNQMISLPIYPDLDKKKQQFVIKKIKEFFKK